MVPECDLLGGGMKGFTGADSTLVPEVVLNAGHEHSQGLTQRSRKIVELNVGQDILGLYFVRAGPRSHH